MNTLRSENLDTIKKLLSNYPDGLCINEIAKILDRHRNSVSRDLHALLVSGQVQAHAFGTTRIFTLVQRDQTFSILDAVHDRVFILDSKRNIVDANASLLEFLGERRESIISRNVYEFPLISAMIPWESPGAMPGGGLHDTTTPFHSKDGLFHYEVRSKPILCDDGDEGLVIVINDRSDVENLRAMNEQERFYLDAITGDLPLLVVNFLPDGRTISGNAKYISRFFPSSQTAEGTEFYSLLKPSDAESLKSCICGLSPQERVTSHIFSMNDPSGGESIIGWKFHGIFDGELHLHCVVGIGSDITDSIPSRNPILTVKNHIKLLSKAIDDFQRAFTRDDVFSCIPLHITALIPGSRVTVFEVHSDRGTCCLRATDGETRDMVQLLIPDGASKALLFPLVNPDAPTVSMATPDPGSYIWSSTTFFHSFLAHLNAGANILAWASQTDRVCCAGIGENGKIYGVVEIFSDRNSILECEEFLVYYLRLATLALRQIAILQAQRISEEQFQIIAVNSPHPISIIDQNGRYIYLNPRFSELFGYTLDDVPDGKTWFIKAFPDFSEQRRARELWKKDLASSSPGIVRPRQFCVRCKDGQLLEILFLSMMMSNGNHIVIYRDMTPVSEAVQKQSLFNGLFLSSHDAIFSVTPDGRVLSWNPAAERIYGYPAGEIEGKDITILEPPHLKGEVHRILKKVIEGVPLVNYETQRIRRDGKVIDVSLTTSPILNDKGDIVGASTIARDISRKKSRGET